MTRKRTGDTMIRWTNKTWNPTSGCRQISAGCDHCYALTLAEKFRGSAAFPVGFDPVLKPNRMKDPLRWKDPAMIFVNSMSDIFLGDWPREYIDEVFDVMLEADWHTYQILTKRPKRMRDYLVGTDKAAPHGLPDLTADTTHALYHDGYLARRNLYRVPDHIWPGATIENDLMTFRADVLREIPARVRMISAEPLLGPLPSLNLDGLGWVIVGGESGNHIRKDSPRWMLDAWATDLRDRCVGAGVPYFFKQHSGIRTEMGPELEGERWEQIPQIWRNQPALGTMALL
jgi:protein gp37